MTLEELMKTTTQTEIFNGTELDEASQDAVVQWFLKRELCDDDNFLLYFRRKINAIQPQYDQYLRIMSVTFDPMVSEYYEKQILRNSKQGKKEEGTNEQSGSTNADGTTNGSTTTQNTQTNNLTQKNSGSIKDDFSRDLTDTGNEQTTGSSLTGDIPMSSVYKDAEGNVYYPEKLNWEYLSNQNENKNNSDNSLKQTGTTTNTKTNDLTTADTGTIENDGSITDESSHSTTITSSLTDKKTASSDLTINDDEKERLTGRHEAPQDMLNRARAFITQTNAFTWLIKNLEPCFFQIYEL